MSGTKAWRPTGGKDGLLDGRLNTGTWNGKPIYIHYTSHEGLEAIEAAARINATPKQDRRGGKAKNGMYLNPVLQTFCPLEALTLLFFDNEKYRLSSIRMLVFSFLKQPAESFFRAGPITAGSWVQEIIYERDVPFNEIDILYKGPNSFVELRHQSYPVANVAQMFRHERSI